MMKTFKFGLVGLLIGLFGFINFGSCGSYTISGHSYTNSTTTNNYKVLIGLPIYGYNPVQNLQDITLVCSITNPVSIDLGYSVLACWGGSDVSKGSTSCYGFGTVKTSKISDGIDFEGWVNSPVYAVQVVFSNYSNPGPFSFDWSCTLSGSNIMTISNESITCPEVDTGSILSGYVSESLLNECITDKNSCQSSISGYNTSLSNCSNSLNTCNTNLNSCLQSNCGDIQWSALYINNIQHLSSPVINIDIPEEISWDYTGDENSFDLNVEGYNVDTEYIEGIINTQNSKPNNQDFNNIIVGVLPLLIPGFVIIMFIYFIFRLIKKIF